jgi:hypothetical protein
MSSLKRRPVKAGVHPWFKICLVSHIKAKRKRAVEQQERATTMLIPTKYHVLEPLVVSMMRLLVWLELELQTNVSTMVAFHRISPRWNHLTATTVLLQMPYVKLKATSIATAVPRRVTVSPV